MDYKTTQLTHNVDVKDALFPEISGLFFGVLSKGRAVFDCTTYLIDNKLTDVDYKVFMRTNKHFIESLAKLNDISTAELFYQNIDGHILIASELVFLFLAFANQELLGYFNALLTDVITDGVAYSSGFVYSMAATRLPTDILQDIIKEQQNDTAGDEQ